MNKLASLLSLYQTYSTVITQLFRYGIVGLCAAGVHFASVVFLVQIVGYTPLMANMFVYPCSFQVSYWGHRLWTFDGTTTPHLTAFPKLVMIQIVNFLVGQSLFYIFLRMHIPYQVGLLILLSTLPIFTFISSRLWVFN
jgi:putative flippase GtrA